MMSVTVNLARAFSVQKKRVLVVDLNPQAETSNELSKTSSLLAANSTIFEAMLGYKSIENCIQTVTKIKNIHLLPATIRLMTLSHILHSDHFKSSIHLIRALELVQHEYDYILIDCPPWFSILSANGLVASDCYLTPIDTSNKFAMVGITDLKNFVRRVLGNDFKLKLWGLLPLNYHPRDKICQSNLMQAREMSSTIFDSIPIGSGKGEAFSRNKMFKEYELLTNEVAMDSWTMKILKL